MLGVFPQSTILEEKVVYVMLRVGSLFSGFGGLELGLEQTGGFSLAFQVELDPYCQRVLQKHWPHVPKYGDIRTLSGHDLERPDLLVGGFPCQNISFAGKQEGLSGAQSGLWHEFARLIGELRPRYVIVENVAALRYPTYPPGEPGRASPLAAILGDLAAYGYDAQWCTLYAHQFGYPHSRERCFVVAYPHGLRRRVSLLDYVPPCIFPTREGVADKLGERGSYLARFEQRLGEPSVFGNNPGTAHRMERLRGLGNMVMPAMARVIGLFVLACEEDEAGASVSSVPFTCAH